MLEGLRWWGVGVGWEIGWGLGWVSSPPSWSRQRSLILKYWHKQTNRHLTCRRVNIFGLYDKNNIGWHWISSKYITLLKTLACRLSASSSRGLCACARFRETARKDGGNKTKVGFCKAKKTYFSAHGSWISCKTCVKKENKCIHQTTRRKKL